jgi:PAS domain-containing protein
MRDAPGAITGILESGRAVQQKTEDTASETQLRLLVEQMPVLLWTTDWQLRITSNGVRVCGTPKYTRETWWGARLPNTSSAQRRTPRR